MLIRFTSTLTDDDEARLAPALLKAVANLLEPFPISYSLRIETTAGDILEDGRAGAHPDAWMAPGPAPRRDGHAGPFGPRR